MQACVDWVLIILGTQVIKKEQPVRPVFPDYLFVSCDYALTCLLFSNKKLCVLSMKTPAEIFGKVNMFFYNNGFRVLAFSSSFYKMIFKWCNNETRGFFYCAYKCHFQF